MSTPAPWRRYATRHTIVKVVLVLLNLLTTWLMLFTGLNENMLMVFVTGKYDVVRHRLRHGGITYNIARPEIFRAQDLASPEELADYLFITTPRRDLSSIGESRQVCLNINTNSAPVMLSNYDDFWGKTSRRIQIYINSISTPYCEVLNVKPAWRDSCVAASNGNATLCHEYVLANFDMLREDRKIRMGVVKDIGAKGVPFLRCIGRPLVPFKFTADMINHQAYWAGAEYHITMQSSDCQGMPLVRTSDEKFTLFQVKNVDEAAEMLVMLPRGGWFAELIPWLHSVVTLVLIVRGIVLALFHTHSVNYLPHAIRFTGQRTWIRYAMPFMEFITRLSDDQRSTITFKGSLLIASDVWMTHWLYMWLSILDAVVNIRATYVTLQIAESLLILKSTRGNLIFLCGALVKITWLMCLVQTALRALFKLGARCLRSLRLIRSQTREKIEWNVDGISILLSYRVYYVLLFVLTLVLIEVNGNPSFMVQANPYKTGIYGGPVKIEGFWGSELACDLVTLLGFLAIAGQVLGVGLMYTNFKYVADNKLMRFLQQRYMLSGWDGLLAADMVGLDPWDPDLIIDGHGYTKLSLGSMLQLLYLSGPSGFVHMAGDYIFHDNGFAKDPVKFSYPVPRALAMGLFRSGKGSAVSTSAPITGIEGSHKPENTGGPTQTIRTREEVAAALVAKRSIFDRRLRIVSDGYLGKILFIDVTQEGQLMTNKETGQREYQVVDALTTMTILDIKYLMGSEKKIRVQ